MEWISRLTEVLANLSIKHVLMGVGVLMVALTAFRLSSRRKDPMSDWMVENIQVVLSVIVVVFLIIRPFLFQAFYIPSGSMEPTLMGPENEFGGSIGHQTTGDRLLVNKLIYRFFDPKRKDIVVFKAPPQASSDEKEFIKRTIGLPGETIEVVPPRLVVDGKTAMRIVADSSDSDGSVLRVEKEAFPINVRNNVAPVRLPYQEKTLRVIVDPRPDVRFDPYRVEVNGKVELQDQSGQIQRMEGVQTYGGDKDLQATVFSINGDPQLIVVTGNRMDFDPGHVLVNGQRLDEPYIAQPPYYAMAPVELKGNEYFMMGDNRNNSNDSHVWKALTRDRVIGRAEVLFWPVTRFRILHWWLVSVLAGAFVAYQLVLKALDRS